MIANRIIAWAIAFALTIAPALADGVSIPGLMSIGGKTSVQFPPTASAPSLACAYTPVTTGTEGTAYTGATPSPSGGTSPYTFSETGTLPTGLSINTSTGVISGAPSVSGSFPSIQVSVTDSASHTANCGTAFTLVISPSGGGAAVTFNAAKSLNTFNAGTAATATITPPSAVSVGDLIVVAVGVGTLVNTDPGAITITGGTGAWTPVANAYIFNTEAANGFRRGIFVHIVQAGEPSSYTASWTNSNPFSVALLDYSGASSTPLDVATPNTFNLNTFALELAQTCAVPPATTNCTPATGSADLEIAVYMYNGTSSSVAGNALPTALTSRVNQDQISSTAPWIGIGDIQLSSTTIVPQKMTSTNSTSGIWIWSADSLAISP